MPRARAVWLVAFAGLAVAVAGWIEVDHSGDRFADRYHSRNRTPNFYARSAHQSEVVQSGASRIGKPRAVRAQGGR